MGLLRAKKVRLANTRMLDEKYRYSQARSKLTIDI